MSRKITDRFSGSIAFFENTRFRGSIVPNCAVCHGEVTPVLRQCRSFVRQLLSTSLFERAARGLGDVLAPRTDLWFAPDGIASSRVRQLTAAFSRHARDLPSDSFAQRDHFGRRS
jgi:hypothetical protein